MNRWLKAAVYDFRNELKKGQGKLVIIDLNGEADAQKISQQMSALTGAGRTTFHASR